MHMWIRVCVLVYACLWWWLLLLIIIFSHASTHFIRRLISLSIWTSRRRIYVFSVNGRQRKGELFIFVGSGPPKCETWNYNNFFFGVLWAPHTLYYFVFSFVGFVAIALLVVVVPDIFRQVIRIVSRISDECGRSNEVLFSILWKGSHTHTRCHTEPKNMIEAISECRKCR